MIHQLEGNQSVGQAKFFFIARRNSLGGQVQVKWDIQIFTIFGHFVFE